MIICWLVCSLLLLWLLVNYKFYYLVSPWSRWGSSPRSRRVGPLDAHIGVKAQSTLRGKIFCPKNMYEKLTKCPNFRWVLPDKLSKYPNFMIFVRKITKFSKFTWFLPENARILHNNCPENIFPEFRRGGGHVPSALCAPPLPPVSYAYADATKTN